MGAGQFDRRIVIQQPIEDQDSGGDLVINWTTFGTVWAQLLPGGGGESFESGQRTSQQRVQFRIRNLDGVTPRMRISWRSKYYQIDDVGEPDRDRTLILTCTAIENQSGTGS